MLGCQDCIFAKHEATFFIDSYDGNNFTSQQEVYCSLHNNFYLNEEIPEQCKDSKYGENNGLDVYDKYYKDLYIAQHFITLFLKDEENKKLNDENYNEITTYDISEKHTLFVERFKNFVCKYDENFWNQYVEQ